MTVKVNDVAFVRFEAPDLDAMESFLSEFGLHRSARDDQTLYMRGTDDEGFIHVTHLADEPRFVGLAFAATPSELDELAARAEFSDVGELEGPGRGKVVRTTDPTASRSRSLRSGARSDASRSRPLHHETTAQPIHEPVPRFGSRQDRRT